MTIVFHAPTGIASDTENERKHKMNKIVSRILLSVALFAIAFCCNSESRAQYSNSTPFRIPLTYSNCTASGPGNPMGVPPPDVQYASWYDIGWWQIYLMNNGEASYFTGTYPNDMFDSPTQNATIAWQKGHGIKPSGNVDQATFTASGLTNPQIPGPNYAAFLLSLEKTPHRELPYFDKDFRIGMSEGYAPQLPAPLGREWERSRVYHSDVWDWQDFLIVCGGEGQILFLTTPTKAGYPNGDFDEQTTKATKKFQESTLGGNPVLNGPIDPATGKHTADGIVDKKTFDKAKATIKENMHNAPN
jgi:peptidoglycan hydrolase-like protein with peptidoglycan-binding domain